MAEAAAAGLGEERQASGETAATPRRRAMAATPKEGERGQHQQPEFDPVHAA